MKRICVVVPWPAGLHLRPAAQLVAASRRFRSTIQLHCGDKIADVRSILSIVALCAAMGTGLIVDISGDDEQEASQQIEQVFGGDQGPPPSIRS